tara:strand:- start:3755 stop:4048 length:294 start_codon:yes stop_codon:yes gene_type:complete
MTRSIELARRDEMNFRSVRLSFSEEGLRLDAQDMGPDVERAWGHDDYEFWVSVKAQEFPALLTALLREKYSGDIQAVSKFREFCERIDIPHEFTIWP